MPIDPRTEYLHLTAAGTATVLPGGEHFWSLPTAELDRLGSGWLVSEFEFTADWSNWEVHPIADELVYVLSGDVEFVFDEPSGLRCHRVRERGLVVVPRAVWHTALVHATSRVLHITMGAGTEHRPAKASLRARIGAMRAAGVPLGPSWPAS